MGMYTSVHHPDDGRELQFHAGNDFCDHYNVGDEVSFVIHRDCAGSGGLFDGVYDTYSDKGEDDWVIIKDHRVVAVEPREGNSYEDLYAKYGIQEPEKSLWSDEAWREHDERLAKSRAELEAYEKTLEGLSPTERTAKMLCYPLRKSLETQAVGRRIFLAE